MSIQDEINKTALQILGEAPDGLRFGELKRRVHDALPHVKENTVFTTVSTLATRRLTGVVSSEPLAALAPAIHLRGVEP